MCYKKTLYLDERERTAFTTIPYKSSNLSINPLGVANIQDTRLVFCFTEFQIRLELISRQLKPYAFCKHPALLASSQAVHDR